MFVWRLGEYGMITIPRNTFPEHHNGFAGHNLEFLKVLKIFDSDFEVEFTRSWN